MNENLIVNAQLYASRRDLEIGERLGSGKDGIVFVAKRKTASARVAIKAHRFEELYFREKLAYERLRKLDINSICGFNVPQIVEFDDVLKVLEMTIVKRPFVLDFAAAYLDRRPEFSADVWVTCRNEFVVANRREWPAGALNSRLGQWLMGHKATGCAGASVIAFGILGAEADPALDELRRIQTDSKDSFTADRAGSP